jgi:murein L,D-transpeptidase YafK
MLLLLLTRLDRLLHLLVLVLLGVAYYETMHPKDIMIPRDSTAQEVTTSQKQEATPPPFEMQITDKPLDLTKVALKERLKALDVRLGEPIFIRIFKKEALLEVWIKADAHYVHLKDYPICFFSGRLGPKIKEGDRQSPEGFYRVTQKALNPNSKFHLSFNLGFPNAYDRVHGRTGSFLMVHGGCVSTGCYAMRDRQIEEIYSLVEEGLKEGQSHIEVHAFPFKMTKEQMAWHQENQWYDFWVNLKEGYDYFEAQKSPPKITVHKGRYEINE